jgi:hypothetical protein
LSERSANYRTGDFTMDLISREELEKGESAR